MNDKQYATLETLAALQKQIALCMERVIDDEDYLDILGKMSTNLSRLSHAAIYEKIGHGLVCHDLDGFIRYEWCGIWLQLSEWRDFWKGARKTASVITAVKGFRDYVLENEDDLLPYVSVLDGARLMAAIADRGFDR